MTLAPPRPIDTDNPDREAPPDTTALRRQAEGLRLAAALFLVPAVVLAALAVAEIRLWAGLARDGLRAPAEVVGASTWKWSDRIRVAFATPDGRLVEASIPVHDLYRFSTGQTVEVAYDAANPRRVRTIEDWNPPYVFPVGMAVTLALLALGMGVRSWRWPRRLQRVAATDRAGRPMVLASVTVSGRAPVPWAVLWDRDAPPSARPELAFRLPDVKDAPAGAIDVELVAERRRKAVGFVRTATGVIWPAGKIRQLPRAVRRAVEKAERALEEANPGQEASGSTPAGAAMPDVRGDLPPLPPDFFQDARAKDPATPKAFLAVIPMVLVITAPFLYSDVVEAHRQVCPKPPPAAPGVPGVVAAEALAASLPTSLPRWELGAEGVRGLGSFGNPATVAALADAGYVSGYQRFFVLGATSIKVEVFQFDSDLGPLRYEARRLASQCALGPKRLPVPDGMSGVWLPGVERPINRITFVRGSRDYIINVEGDDLSGVVGTITGMLRAAQ